MSAELQLCAYCGGVLELLFDRTRCMGCSRVLYYQDVERDAELRARVEKAELRLASALEILRYLEWEGVAEREPANWHCPVCMFSETQEKHAPDCKLANVLNGGEG